MNDTADILDRAADLIEFEGHWQGEPSDDEHRTYCPVLAVREVAPSTTTNVNFVLGRYLGLAVEPPYDITAIFDWNDSTPTAEVIDAMRRCAKSLREVASA